jgi:hypothetical protein
MQMRFCISIIYQLTLTIDEVFTRKQHHLDKCYGYRRKTSVL